MVTLYWILEYGKVLFGYLFLMFLWPSVVFKKYLSGKSKMFRFSFCTTAQVVIINTVVLSLGLFHILNKWIVVAIFYGVFFWSLLKEIRVGREDLKKIQRLLLGSYGIKSFLFGDAPEWLKGKWQGIWKEIRPRFGEYLLLLIALVYALIYFSYGAFQDYSYGFGDLYTHHSWIYGLIEGNIFSDGVYPEGMHCFIYCMYALLNIKVYSILLFLQGIHVIVFLLSAYCLLREVFRARYTPIFVLVLFLILDLKSFNAVESMSRLQWTLPQEFGLHTQFLCACYLIRYLKSSRHIEYNGKRSRFCWDENLLVFVMALAASIAIHFYPVIMAFLLCVSFALFSLKKVFDREHFIPLVAAVVCGGLIAAVPMAGAFASGIKMQYSLRWAMSVIDESMGNAGEEETSAEGTAGAEDEEESSGEDETAFPENAGRNEGILNKIVSKARGVYIFGYSYLYGEARAKWIIRIAVFAGLMWLLYRLYDVTLPACFGNRFDGNYFDRKYYDGYPMIIFASFLYVTAYSAQSIGLPQLISERRLCSSIHILILAVILIPFDMLLSALAFFYRERLLQIAAVAAMAGSCVLTVATGCYHGYLYYELTRYNAAVMVTNSIIETLPQHSYTIVSPTDELYQTILEGRHEELLTFLERSTDKSYILPTEYVFIYVEKKPIRYAQNHYFTGPSWLAWEREKYDIHPPSQCPEIDAAEISEEAAGVDIMRLSNLWWTYTQLDSRTILESKAYEWCRRFAELYPYEMNVYYEDDDFACYYFRQEPSAPYNLAIG